MKEKPEFIKLAAPCRKRIYIFPGGDKIEFKNVTEIAVSSSGNHRLNMEDGTKAIVCSGWIAILLDMDEWTF